MAFVSILCFFFSGYAGLLYSFNFCDILENNMEFFLSISLSWYSLFFFVMLFFCGVMSLNYSLHYQGYNSYDGNLLYINMLIFLITMVLLSTTSGLLSSLVMWEYLGVVSFFLILFYENYVSLRAAVITLVTSRVGDVFFFLLVGYSMVNVSWENVFLLLLGLSLWFVVGSKSAFFPMSSWLLEAMRAPTPVSALVHSSTLVAAGVWFMLCYWNNIYNLDFCFFGLICCLVTTIVTGVSSLIISDSKKIVALSTSNNISWCLIYIFSGFSYLAVLQLLVHGLGKCLFFIIMGNIMSSGEGAQEYKGFHPSVSYINLGSTFFSVFCLSGAPMLGIYFSKHFFFSSYFGETGNYFFSLLLLVSFFVTNLYSARLIAISCGTANGNSVSYETNFGFSLYVLLFVGIVCLFNSTLLSESIEGNMRLGFIIIFLFIAGSFFGLVLYNMLEGGLKHYWYGTSLGYMDYLVNSANSFYSFIFGVSLLSLYRWDYSMISIGYQNITNNVLVLSGISSLFIFLLFFV
nr:NADH dehydrogenase subunit 5 [Microcotyle caudata]